MAEILKLSGVLRLQAAAQTLNRSVVVLTVFAWIVTDS